MLPEYALYWITASFFLYVIYPFLLLVPSSTAPAGRTGASAPSSRLSERFGGSGLAEHRWTIAKIFWNSFFINSQPLAPAFMAIYSLNILFALLRDEGLIGWLIIFQSAAILVFYLAIAVFKPYTGGFLESVIGHPEPRSPQRSTAGSSRSGRSCSRSGSRQGSSRSC